MPENKENDFFIASLLKPGRQNATSTKQLLALTGYKHVRDLQLEIARERNQGALILSGSDPGYWLPESKADIERYVYTMEQRGKNIFRAVQSARKALGAMPGQLELLEILLDEGDEINGL